jgi:hypothetical protein
MATPCWVWTAYRDEKGYGRLMVDGKIVRAHRVAWSLRNGPVPEGLHVLHECDYRACVNPQHLHPGTDQQNNDEKVARGRQSHAGHPGEKNPSAKLSIEQVRDAFSRRDGGETQGAIAAHFGVSRSAIQLVLARKTWRGAA